LAIKNITKKDKIDYFGHSQGAVAIVAALSDIEDTPRESLRDLLSRIFIVAPVIYLVFNLI